MAELRESQRVGDKNTGIFLTIIFALARMAGLSKGPNRDLESKTSKAMDGAIAGGVSVDETLDAMDAGMTSGTNEKHKG
jgi:hypothetical protein